MTATKVLKNLVLMSALAGALLVMPPASARDRHFGEHHQSGHDRGHRGGWQGHGWGGHRDYQHGWHDNGWRNGGNRHHYAAPRHHYYYAPPRHHYHRHYRGCGHDGYGHSGLIEFVVDYSRYGH